MADINEENDISDDEIFFGKMTMKEVKKRIFMNNPPRRTINCFTSKQENKDDKSIRIIETCSEPDLITIDDTIDSNLKSVSTPNVIIVERTVDPDVESEDSFIRLEKLSELCVSSTENQQPQLDNTLDTINFILNSADQNKEALNNCALPHLGDPIFDTKNKEEKSKICTDIVEVCNLSKVKSKNDVNTTECNNTPIYVTNNFSNTPSNKGHLHPNNTNIRDNFKTPKNQASSKKLAVSSQKTPKRNNAYQHIASPIACYIKNCPQVPMFKDVHPRKPLPRSHSIPIPINTLAKNKSTNKENIQLPSIAYKSAKKTELVSAPNQKKLPRGEWPNKLASKLRKPVVLTHKHRVVDSATKNLNERKEDSFDQTLQQADLSVCIAKSAFS